MPRRYWLFKSEPGTYSFDDFVRDGATAWDGVRNFQARNFLRDDIQEGDGILFYHSSTKPQAVIGTAQVTKRGYPDESAWDATSHHIDPKSSPANPTWYVVDLAPVERFGHPVTLEDVRQIPELENMELIRRGSRLSIQPVREQEWEAIRKLGRPQPLQQ